MLDDMYLGLMLSILLGLLIGAQREIRQQRLNKKDFAGLRTFTFISILGYIIGFFSFEIINDSSLFILTFFGLILLMGLTYFIVPKVNSTQIGITSQVSALLTFLIGVLISLKYYQITIGLAIIIATILALGTKLHSFVKKVKTSEVYATLEFAIISLVILPLLPNKNYSPLDLPFIGQIFLSQKSISLEFLAKLDVFNFYYLWLMVVFISGIAYVGYILMRTIGAKKGIIITGFLGGFMSSTALTSSFSIESREYKGLSNPLALGVIIACSTMFFRIIFEVLVINPELVYGVFMSLGLMGITGFILAGYIMFRNHNDKKTFKKFETDSPFSIKPALKFALLFLFITFFSKLFTLIYGNSGIYILAFISGITDVDAITISLLTLAKQNSISNITAQFGIIIAAISNTLFKGGIAYYLGSHEFFQKVFFVFSIILAIGGISMFI
ncbi:MAG: MgtC/SapB family protein [Candidatus Woesearchaeota archaeon]|jgi:uncharacterized membrane protein (DUF4010 family)|nr:MgtC/SapB family protein [Candidatus Woesearchaeota archaeon]